MIPEEYSFIFTTVVMLFVMYIVFNETIKSKDYIKSALIGTVVYYISSILVEGYTLTINLGLILVVLTRFISYYLSLMYSINIKNKGEIYKFINFLICDFLLNTIVFVTLIKIIF